MFTGRGGKGVFTSFNQGMGGEDLADLNDGKGFDGAAVALHRGGHEQRVVDGLFDGFEGGFEEGRHVFRGEGGPGVVEKAMAKSPLPLL
jgi:hypothetical protein